ncbi:MULTISPECIES: hypothetical protein [unclassified Flavobacterium]|uniref:hypothetical protein n=1 Tax=unclassified Flavobacterium TaxID=196869 RepID=UPI0018E7A005|nr:hypothetical protein [Flavobacterium sp. IB48]MBJ2125022.1 hypothetical protein [Flavobacterium sp. IB48]
MTQDNNVEKSVFEEIPTEKIYSKKAISTATFFGGPLVAGYCIAENFKTFNDLEKARNTWIITAICTIVIIGISFSLPENFPKIVFPVIYSFIASYIIQTYQEENIQKHNDNGGDTYGGWRVTLITLLGFLILFGLIMAIAVFFYGI